MIRRPIRPAHWIHIEPQADDPGDQGCYALRRDQRERATITAIVGFHETLGDGRDGWYFEADGLDDYGIDRAEFGRYETGYATPQAAIAAADQAIAAALAAFPQILDPLRSA